jgi:hypothetical protein
LIFLPILDVQRDDAVVVLLDVIDRVVAGCYEMPDVEVDGDAGIFAFAA